MEKKIIIKVIKVFSHSMLKYLDTVQIHLLAKHEPPHLKFQVGLRMLYTSLKARDVLNK